MDKKIIRSLHAYIKKKSRLHEKIENDYVKQGIATIPCKVSGIDDIIDRLSVENYETLSPDFENYIIENTRGIPITYPLALNVRGPRFTDSEKKIIRDTVEKTFTFMLGYAEKEYKRHLINLVRVIIACVVSAVLILCIPYLDEFAHELLTIVAWFFVGMLISFIFFDGHRFRIEKILASRLALMRVVFSEKGTKNSYREEEVEKYYRELIEKRDR